MPTERDVDAIQTWEHESGYIGRATGPRREPPTACYECGDDADEPVYFDAHFFCSRACLDAWVRR